ncbi:MAG: (2Fe-2S)-binding protein [Candidatus Eiseniibacteriota bacterium]|nr:MAG: (2Fe-2S)-binding protein [Candidatus Eisenbacteria bacterium]
MKETFRFLLNGNPTELALDGERMLLWVLRADLGLTGTKYGCGEGHCGACTVLVDGEAVRSCRFPIEAIRGKEVITVEGLSRNGDLHPLQKAFISHDALQCGFCTPGMLISAYGLLTKNLRPTREEIVEAMEGNLCRCGSYGRVIQAIQAVGREMREGVNR